MGSAAESPGTAEPMQGVTEASPSGGHALPQDRSAAAGGQAEDVSAEGTESVAAQTQHNDAAAEESGGEAFAVVCGCNASVGLLLYSSVAFKLMTGTKAPTAVLQSSISGRESLVNVPSRRRNNSGGGSGSGQAPGELGASTTVAWIVMHAHLQIRDCLVHLPAGSNPLLTTLSRADRLGGG